MPQDIPAPLAPERLHRRTELAHLGAASSAELDPVPGLDAFPRAHEAIALAATTRMRGFNLFAIGESAARIKDDVLLLLDEEARGRPCPHDWVYVNNFSVPHRPIALSLPPGHAPALRQAVREVVADLRAGLPAVFESEDYERRRNAIQESFQGKAEKALQALGEKAATKGIAILRTPSGFAVAPVQDGKVVPPEAFNAWPAEKQAATRAELETIEKELEQAVRAIPRLEKERREATRALEQETARVVIDQAIEEAKAGFAELPAVLEYIETMRADLMEHVPLFLAAAPGAETGEAIPVQDAAAAASARYDVNILLTTDNGGRCAPVVVELNPTVGNLLGRVEHLTQQGVLVTNYRLIKAGSLHRANGGVILIDARALLTEAMSWPALKRALGQERIVIEDIGRMTGFSTTVSLEPDPIPLDVKVVLFGDRTLYYLLASVDPDLAEHFKILADFDDDADRTPETEAMLARLIAGALKAEGLPVFGIDAIERLVEQAARMADDGARLALQVEPLRDIAVEAAQVARKAGRTPVGAVEIEAAIKGQRRRAARAQERMRASILDGIALIDTEGARAGQVNGLSVYSLGGQSFGRPTRISARVRPGTGRILDIEREVALGGPLHSKGVLILSGYFAGRYAEDVPLAVQASLVFEQSYGGVDGDSASTAELCVLTSAIGEIPIRQDIAITGSVNQHGEVQAIGGVNEKIEGFFDICATRGLTGTQGVIIPASNIRHLMLRRDVVEACAAGRFAVWPVRMADEALALLTGLEPGARNESGAFPDGSIHRRVEDRLRHFATLRRDWGGEAPAAKA